MGFVALLDNLHDNGRLAPGKDGDSAGTSTGPSQAKGSVYENMVADDEGDDAAMDMDDRFADFQFTDDQVKVLAKMGFDEGEEIHDKPAEDKGQRQKRAKLFFASSIKGGSCKVAKKTKT